VLLYRDNARRLVLALKHGDRIHLARPCGAWLASHAEALLGDRGLILPIPLHWTRLVRRRFNQSALLAHAVAKQTGHSVLTDALVRKRRTPSQEQRSRADRMANVAGAMALNPARADDLKGRDVLLLDDVLTSGATFAEATRVLLAAGVGSVSVLALARVAKDM
jgi:ComF family protein